MNKQQTLKVEKKRTLWTQKGKWKKINDYEIPIWFREVQIMYEIGGRHIGRLKLESEYEYCDNVFDMLRIKE